MKDAQGNEANKSPSFGEHTKEDTVSIAIDISSRIFLACQSEAEENEVVGMVQKLLKAIHGL